ncbi:MAG TPA: YlbF family regulator [Gemmatimonadaceae bacterium]|nr:YlbF family regulator [Gemmatimonadaceae bacterium]
MLEEKAKDVGRLIGQSPEYQTLKRSSDALNNDREAVALLQEMEKLRGEAQQLIQRGENPTAEMEQQLDSMLEKIQGQPAYQRAVAAQENFDKLMLRVNQWIMDGMKKGAASPIITLS